MRTVRLWVPVVVFAALGVSLLLEVFTIVPRLDAVAMVAVLCWMAAPGVTLFGRAFRCHPSARGARWLLGPALGLGMSVFALLLLWAAGLQGWLAVLLAPSLTWLLAWLAGRAGGVKIRLPVFGRRDAVAVGCALLVVPLVTFAPFDHVRQPTGHGEAYRAYFTADFVWAMTVTAEVAKGDMPPANPFLTDQPLRYYWLSHLLSSALYRNLRGAGVMAEQIVLVNALGFSLCFVALFYALARSAGGTPAICALAVSAAFLANSYEGLDRILVLREYDSSLDNLRAINIDAVTRWFYGGMPVDGLQRMLLYQPHHFTGYALALAALWLVGGWAEDVTEAAVALWTGSLLGLGFLFSTFTAIIVGAAVGMVYAFRLAQRRAWGAVWSCAVLGGVPVLVAVGISMALGYTDTGAGSLMVWGVNPVAVKQWPLMLLLSFGPLLLAGILGLLRFRWVAREGAAAAALIAAALLFYFCVDVPDQDGVWVGWRSGHLLLIAFAVVGAAALTAAWRFPRRRPLLVAGSLLAIIPAVPTVIIDVYNAQDIDNHGYAASFPWTLFVTPLERDGLDWIRRSTPVDAVVQVDPRVRHSGTWAYVPAFGERRMAAGLPVSMVPRRLYEMATDNVTFGIFHAQKPHDAWEMAHFLKIDYLLVGEPERRRYPAAVKMLGQDPRLFIPQFENQALTVYKVAPR